MRKTIWLNVWDLRGIAPSELVAELRDLGLTGCRLGLAYHGGRIILPRNRERRVYEQHRSAIYFKPGAGAFDDLRLRPPIADEAILVEPFLRECRKADFTAEAWAVFCHNDFLGETAPDACAVNCFGDRYSHALCPANEDARRYAIALAAAVAQIEGIAAIDAEAVSFMGLEHGGLHDKRGVQLPAAIDWLLSICLCAACRDNLGADAADDIGRKSRFAVGEFFENFPNAPDAIDLPVELAEILGAENFAALLEHRRRTVKSLLAEMRENLNGKPLNLRLAASPLFNGGKTALDWADAADAADEATLTFFGKSTHAIAAEINALPATNLKLHGGLMFHQPDCAAQTNLREKVELFSADKFAGLAFYSYGMATRAHLQWLKRVLREI